MKNSKKKTLNKNFNLVCKLVSIFLSISVIVAVSFIIYFEILPLTFLSIFIIVGGLLLFLLIKLVNSKLKKWIRVIFIIISLICIIVNIFISMYSVNTLNMFNEIFDLGLRTDNYAIYVLDESNYEVLEDLIDKNIGMLNKNKDSIEKEIEKKIDFELKTYDNSVDAISALKDNEVDAIVLLEANMELLQEESEDYDDIVSLYKFNITKKIDTIDKTVDISKDSFLVYISGIDTNGKVYSSARSDVNILIAVNPVDKKILMLNTPRDYYVELPSYEEYDKLTHAGVYGIEESIRSLEKLYDTTINYYARVNFTTFIKIVDALDGIQVYVPVSFCEQTSSRESEDEICLREGFQTLDGEEALALARTRHAFLDGDRSRIQNQMLVLEALIDKAISPKIITSYSSIISKLGDSVVTNVDEKDITKLIKKQIEDMSEWTIETYSTDGFDSYKSIYSAGNSNAYVMEPNIETVLTAQEKLKNILDE